MAAQSTAVLGQFLNFVNGFVKEKNEGQLTDYIALEPPFGGLYQKMIQEMQSAFPVGREQALEARVEKALTAARDAEWTTFVNFMVQYLSYLRDVTADPGRYLETYEGLSALQRSANSALGHGAMGYLILGVVVRCAKCVCRLAIGLDKRPELIAHLKSGAGDAGAGDDGPRETLPERAANILRTAFTTCLNDRSTTAGNGLQPEGKKRGIYLIANLCLKILFQCRKTRNATQIFENIYHLSPPLTSYPKSQRVTYLYYLGRFLFLNSHFYRAQLALQAAFDECPNRADCVRQRRHILVYLVFSNLVLGRFPSPALLDRPEAQGLREHCVPLCQAIRHGDLGVFHQHLDPSASHASWFLHFRALLQIRNRCEVLVWRSIVRKTWIINGTRPAADSRITPQVDLHDIATAFRISSKPLPHDVHDSYTDPDFRGVWEEKEELTEEQRIVAVESKVSSLIDQGLLVGFISHTRAKFAITGTKAKGGNILAAGFPEPWHVLKERAASGQDTVVPGWKKAGGANGLGSGAGPFGGGVVNLSGARPVGVF